MSCSKGSQSTKGRKSWKEYSKSSRMYKERVLGWNKSLRGKIKILERYKKSMLGHSKSLKEDNKRWKWPGLQLIRR